MHSDNARRSSGAQGEGVGEDSSGSGRSEQYSCAGNRHCREKSHQRNNAMMPREMFHTKSVKGLHAWLLATLYVMGKCAERKD